jgi:hypothetical protein
MPDSAPIPDDVIALVNEISRPQPMRRATLTKRFMKCNKPGCACAHDESARHGPYYSLTQRVEGRTRTRYIQPEQVEQVERQIEAGKRFRQQIDAFWQSCRRWADAELEAETTAAKAAEKRGSRHS